jgi:hypothetical protein
MTGRRTIARKHARTRLMPLPALALTAIALGAIAGGCIQNHDPRNDSSRLDSHQPSDLAISREHAPA